MDTVHDDRFHLSRATFYKLMAFSTVWFTVDGFPVLPIGLLFAIRYVGINYETSFLHSLVTGRKVVAASIGMAILGLLMRGPSFGFSLSASGGGLFSLRLPLLAWF
ncbi:hypothetical protein JRI60_35530 [Archangium violaceum]|uniref:hypothetical protein n=1 Tax=Archangium violaceum TaxID=83451 RepID=UPI00194EAF88|nr:hypothetical protein [Archangium violaceum]QRN94417.1 hypothetical protein JRI60_35530 [Archangium violaceum]